MKKATISVPRQVSSDDTVLTKVAAWVTAKNIPFFIIAIGMIVMLFWAGAFKMTAPGAEGIAPLVNNSPFISWDYKIFGPYVGGDLIGLTEWVAGVLILIGFFKPKVGIIGGFIGVLIFFTTSTMLLTTPGDIIYVKGMGYMNNLGLFLYKDIINLGASFYLISYFGRKAAVKENVN
ncbi:MAG: DUF417 family protein [Bacteroidetes bacterium]|jgi:uncharacterized membrane protein YkgB|nr:DUF417 family protein [Bacteroidota bacterium]